MSAITQEIIARCYSAFINAKVMDPGDTRARLGVALAAVAPFITATPPVPAAAGYTNVPLILAPLMVSEIKDWTERDYGLHLTQARPFWAGLLSIVAGVSIDEQEAHYISERGIAPAPLTTVASAKVREAINAAITDVAELPGRTSPEDWPEAMLVTSDELALILDRHFATNSATENGDAEADLRTSIFNWLDTLQDGGDRGDVQAGLLADIQRITTSTGAR